MGKIFWSVDEKKYNDQSAHTLILSGWAADTEERKECELLLYGDGEELPALKISRHYRADVAKNLTELGEVNAGFRAEIPEIPELAGKYAELELFVVNGGEKVSIWKEATRELKEFCADCLMEYKIDREQIMGKNTLMIDGWVLDQRGEAEVRVEDESGRPVNCTITRVRRPDVEEERNIHTEKKPELGFSISVNLEKITAREITILFCGPETKKTYTVNIKKLKAENSVFHQMRRVLAWENREKNVAYIRENGLGQFVRYLGSHQQEGAVLDYEEWLKDHAAGRKELKRQRNAVFSYMPLISIVIPLYNTPQEYLKEIVDSVIAQTYGNWQLCLADGSEGEETGEFLRKKYKKEIRISYKKLKENKGISENTNAAIKLAMGDYIMLCDHDDVLAPDALFHIVKAITEKKADVVYTDEDKVSMDGKHYFEPNFKPDFNLFRLRENNYICHIFAVKKELLEQVGTFRSEYDGAQDFDLIFRCCEQAKKIVHVPRVLYHWRSHMNSTAANPESKRYAFEAGRRAIEAHYKRMGIPATVEMTERPGWYRSHVEIQGEPLISIIIPNKDHIDDLELCISSVEERSTWKNYEILVVENNSENKETFAYYEALKGRYDNVRILTWKKEFNYSSINNFAVKEARGEYLLFLNNDVEIITPSWIEEMLQNCQQDGVGITGAKLYYPDDTIQHAGVVVGLGGIAGHIMCKAPRETVGYMGRMVCVQEISAVTAACMLVKASVFREVGGFDEELKVAFNDIDFCMKVRSVGQKVVFTPYAELYHYESKSRGLEDTPEKQQRFSREVKCFRRKWERELLKGDPYYSPNLSLKEGDCSLRKAERNGD